jgi:hypothetical protein
MHNGIKKRILINELGELEKYYKKIQINIETEPPYIRHQEPHGKQPSSI